MLLPVLLLAVVPAAAPAAAPSARAAQAAPADRLVDEPRSYLTRPLYLSDEPPECRALRRILIRFDSDDPRWERRTREAALELALDLEARLGEGEPFAPLAERFSEEAARRSGGVLGSFPPGLLRPDLESFLQDAELGAVSPVLEGPQGFELLQRVESRAACRTILVTGRDAAGRARALALFERARAGEDFAALAREHSDDPETAARGGDHAIFLRGPEDRLLKDATFRAELGGFFGPLEAPTGYLIGQRVPVEDVSPELFHAPWARARCIFLAHRDVGGPRELTDRTLEETRLLALELHQRLLAGDDMAELAARHGEDLDGRRRRGDLGWLFRENPAMVPVLDRVFLAEPGELLEPQPIEAGWLLLRRER